MKVKDLIEELEKVNPELNVVLCVSTEELDIGFSHLIFDDVWIDMGWEPSGQCSIESKTCIGN